MRTLSAVIERDPDTDWLVSDVPGFPGAHSQAESLDERQALAPSCMPCTSRMAPI